MASASDIANRIPITIAMILATVMNSLDSTIANVALPHIQGELSAAPDQIAWVVTSYLIATAVTAPVTGWLMQRVGMKLMFLVSVGGFTLASMACGAAQDLGQLVLFRFLQGVFGAALIPMGQASVLELFEPAIVPRVMSLWGAATILGPILGPTIGGYLTDELSWRWVFYINLPIGGIALALTLIFMSNEGGARGRPFDFLGFAALGAFAGGLQLALDRGPMLDWFSSREIWIELIISVIGLWIFVTQTVTARHPFLPRGLVLDRNFVLCSLFSFVAGIMLFSTMVLMPPLMQQYMGYTALESGLVSMPRGIATFMMMLLVGRLLGRFDIRLILLAGLLLNAASLAVMAGFSLDMASGPITVSGFVQGLGAGLVFVPLSATAFSTLNPALRSDGAAMYNVTRSLGQAVGISAIQALWTRNTSESHGDLTSMFDMANPIYAEFRRFFLDPSQISSLFSLNAEITRQAAMVSYVDVFKLLMLLTLACAPFLIFIRPAGRNKELAHAAAD